jgi:hypothetical protein
LIEVILGFLFSGRVRRTWGVDEQRADYTRFWIGLWSVHPQDEQSHVVELLGVGLVSASAAKTPSHSPAAG